MSLGDVVNQLHDQDSLSDTGTAEESDLATLGVGGQQIDDLNSSDQDLLLDAHLDELGGFSVDGGLVLRWDGATFIDGLANDVHDASQGFSSDWDSDGGSGVGDLLSADQTFGTVHSDGADGVLSQVLGDFQDQASLTALDFESVQDWWKVVIELHVNDGTNDGDDLKATQEEFESRENFFSFCIINKKKYFFCEHLPCRERLQQHL